MKNVVAYDIVDVGKLVWVAGENSVGLVVGGPVRLKSAVYDLPEAPLFRIIFPDGGEVYLDTEHFYALH